VTPTFVALLSGGIVVFAVIALALLPTLLLAVSRGPASAFGVIAFLIAVVIILYILLRWALGQTAIALEGAGPITALSRSWQVTQGNVWRLGILVVAVGLLGVPWSIAAGLFLLVGNLATAIAIGVLGTLLFGSLAPIAISLAYGDITGRPRAMIQAPATEPATIDAAGTAAGVGPPVVQPAALGPAGVVHANESPAGPAPAAATPALAPLSTTPGLRRTYVLGVFLIGVLLVVPAVAVAGPNISQIGLAGVPPEARGRIVIGTEVNPADPCQPSGQSNLFSSSDTLYIGGYFSRSLLPGQSASIHVYVDGEEVVDSPFDAGVRAVACYYEPAPLVGAPPGSYRIVIDDASGTLAEGSFTVQ
jgi:hypothetical protein